MRTLIDVSLFVHTRRAWHGKQYFTPTTIVVAQTAPPSRFLSRSGARSLSLSARRCARACHCCRFFSFFFLSRAVSPIVVPLSLSPRAKTSSALSRRCRRQRVDSSHVCARRRRPGLSNLLPIRRREQIADFYRRPIRPPPIRSPVFAGRFRISAILAYALHVSAASRPARRVGEKWRGEVTSFARGFTIRDLSVFD